ncbi:MAG: hypothetical protein HRT38_19280 [Alteromonadaceae bacterium]|nr:hypothetical protein [Alteromonadaceae bacterium]
MNIKRKGIYLKIAEFGDIPMIINFLSSEPINNSFKKPLSERNVSITDRVNTKFTNGVWLLALKETEILSCISITKKGVIAELSTLAIQKNKSSIATFPLLWAFIISTSRDNLKCEIAEIDSWEGNIVVEKYLYEKGFSQTNSFFDDNKRPQGVKTVIYRGIL